jgi:hypothetical protein
VTPKLVFHTLALCLLFGGCQTFRKSATWETVVNTRIDTRGAADPSRAYAEGLHDVLVARGVEHKIVTYRYHYRSRTHDAAVAERSAIIYRDETYPKHPWWLKDESIGRPIWLPDGNLDKQVQSYARREVEIVSWEEYLGSDGKTMMRTEWKPVSTLRPAVSGGFEFFRQAALFRKLHGTDFDPKSAMDREKMRAIEARATSGPRS